MFSCGNYTTQNAIYLYRFSNPKLLSAWLFCEALYFWLGRNKTGGLYTASKSEDYMRQLSHKEVDMGGGGGEERISTL